MSRGAGEIAAKQRDAALARGALDFSAAPTWPWHGLHDLAGPLLPGDLWVLGARPGCGKTTFLLSVIDHLTVLERPWLYVGMEMGPDQLRRKWAAHRLGLDAKCVLRNNWPALPPGAREQIDADVTTQTSDLVHLAHFSDARRVSASQLRVTIEFAQTWGCKTIIVDHLHRMQFGTDAGSLTHEMGEAVRSLKEHAIKLGIVVILAAELNRPERELLADYVPPPLSSLKQTGALEEEADAVLLLHKTLRRSVTAGELKEVRQGLKSVTEVIEPNIMAVRVGKHRLDGAAVDKTVWLTVKPSGHLSERLPDWKVA